MSEDYKTIENPLKKFGRIFFNNGHKIFLVIFIVFYVTKGAFELQVKDADFISIITDIIMGLIIGLTINSLMISMGITSAKDTNLYKNALAKHVETKEIISKIAFKLGSFCNYKNKEEREILKRNYIENYGLNYKLYLDNYYDNEEVYEKLTKEEKHALKVVEKLKINILTPKVLMTTDTKFHKRDKGFMSEDEFLRSSVTKKAAYFIIVSFISGYFVLKTLINEETLGNIFWNLFIITMWLIKGFMSYFDAKEFVFEKLIENGLNRKTELLNEFNEIVNNRPEILEETN